MDQIYHLACPASPPHYQYNPVKTIKTSTMGTLNMLGLAKRVRARMLLTSTSEVGGSVAGWLGAPLLRNALALAFSPRPRAARYTHPYLFVVVVFISRACLPPLASSFRCLAHTVCCKNTGVWRPQGAPAARVVLGQREPHRPPRLLRRGEARGGDDDVRLQGPGEPSR